MRMCLSRATAAAPATSVITGKPIALGGSLGRKEATGEGVAWFVKAYLQDLHIEPEKTTVVIQGFGNVGSEAALALYDWGAEVIGISDYTGGIHNAKGIDLKAAIAWVEKNKNLQGFPGGDAITNEQLMELPCTVLIPAALERVITEKNDRITPKASASGWAKKLAMKKVMPDATARKTVRKTAASGVEK